MVVVAGQRGDLLGGVVEYGLGVDLEPGAPPGVVYGQASGIGRFILDFLSERSATSPSRSVGPGPS